MSTRVTLAHGGGGERTRRLIDECIVSRLANAALSPLHDGAVLAPLAGRPVLTTDSFVVQPLRFPGGSIGTLAVCGTVNDLAVMGATPVALTLGLILEEGLEFAVLEAVLDDIAATSREAGVPIVTGDTKVVERGRGDGLVINTAGLGAVPDDRSYAPAAIRPDDIVIVTGTMGDHGLAVLSAREGLSFATTITSDVAPLHGLVKALVATGAAIRVMRDPTRGGVAGVLNDFAESSGLSIEVDETALPVSPAVRHTAEMLGLDPLTIANEGKVVVVVAPEDADLVVRACRAHPLGRQASAIGRVFDEKPPLVEMVTVVGGRRVVARPIGEELPRIC